MSLEIRGASAETQSNYGCTLCGYVASTWLQLQHSSIIAWNFLVISQTFDVLLDAAHLTILKAVERNDIWTFQISNKIIIKIICKDNHGKNDIKIGNDREFFARRFDVRHLQKIEELILIANFDDSNKLTRIEQIKKFLVIIVKSKIIT